MQESIASEIGNVMAESGTLDVWAVEWIMRGLLTPTLLRIVVLRMVSILVPPVWVPAAVNAVPPDGCSRLGDILYSC